LPSTAVDTGDIILPQGVAQGNTVDEKQKAKRQTSKNCPAEAPEGDSIQDLSALCNAADPE
jgi:hypothetical protein